GGSLNVLVREDVNRWVQKGVYDKTDAVRHDTVVEDVAEDYQKNQVTYVKENCQLNAAKIIVEGADLISHKSKKILIEGSTDGVSIKSGADMKLTANGVVSLKGGSKFVAEGQSAASIKAMNVVVEGQASVVMKVGGNFVSIGPAGVDIMGSLVKINSGGSPGGPADTAAAAEAAESTEPFTMEEPLEAAVADDGKPGKVSKVGKGAPRQRKSKTLNPQKAPNTPPFPPPPAPAAGAPGKAGPPPPPPLPPPDCGVQQLVVKCGHSGRMASGPTENQLLQVVQGGPKAKVKRNKLGFEPISFQEVSALDADKISVEAVYGKVCGNGHPRIVVSGAANEGISGTKLAFDAQYYGEKKYFPAFVTPSRYSIAVESCQGGQGYATVECYPGYSVELEVDASELTQKWHKALALAAEIYNTVNAPDGDKFTWEVAKGKVSASWGWEEDDKSHRARFQLTTSIALDPIVGFSNAKFKISVIKYIPSIIRKHVGDLYGFICFNGGLKAELSGKTMKYPGAEWAGQITGGVGGYIGVEVGIEAKATAAEIMSVTIGASLSTKIEAMSKVLLDDSRGVGVDFGVSHGGIRGSVYCKTKGSGVVSWFTSEHSAECEFVPPNKVTSHQAWLFDK
ncbi:MAG: hypothetical protein KF866_11595, partial [Phycisphaeraceae bacterium]|nr:hypothetical protein [Phycisphaeraceae bacterium]